MDLSVYFHRQSLRHPVLPKTESVGPRCLFGALIIGPLYYWKKGARIEAILFCLAGIPLFMYDPGSALLSRAMVAQLTTLAWLASVALAPLLIALSYRRGGWFPADEAADADMENEDAFPARPLRQRSFVDPALD